MKPVDWSRSKHEVVIFFMVTLLLTWLLWLPALLIKNFDFLLPLPYDLFKIMGTFVPSVVGFVLAFIFGGKEEVNSLFRSLLNIRLRARWLFFVFLVLPGVSALSCLIFSFSGNSLPPLQFEPWLIPVVFAYILVFMGPLGEEAGWRGFALKRMLRGSAPFPAALLLGIIWSIWHLPLFFINGTTQNALLTLGMIPAFFGYILYTIMISFLITLLFVMSSGSVFGAVLLHTVGNLSLGIVPLIFSRTGALILLSVLSIITAVIIYKYRKTMFHRA